MSPKRKLLRSGTSWCQWFIASQNSLSNQNIQLTNCSNLFFRTCYLLQTGITPVFVLEGTAPPLKYGVIVKRNQMQFRGARPKKIANCDKATVSSTQTTEKPAKPTEQKRNRFHHVLKQCEELLSAMGLVCVQAPGEAEALCAYLNRDNLIYGVISQDS